MNKKLNIAVPYQINTAEVEVSRESVDSVVIALQELGHNPIEIPFTRNIINDLTKINPDVVFNIMHGKYGEDGFLPTILNVMKIPYTFSGVMASQIGMNKILTNEYAKANNIPYIQSNAIMKSDLMEGKYSIAKKSIIKPYNGGSSVATFVLEPGQKLLKNQLEEIENFTDGNLFIIQEFVTGREVFIGILNNVAIGSAEVLPSEEFYSYNAKYKSGATQYFTPAKVNDSLHKKLMQSAEILHNTIGASCISRVDFICTENEFYLMEINTHPGFTSKSLFPKICKNIGISYNEIIQTLIENAKFEKI